MKKILIFLFGILLVSVALAVAPTLSNIAFTADDETTIVSLDEVGDGYALYTDGNAGTDYEIQFDGTTSSEDLDDELFPLYLIDTTVLKADLKQYYDEKYEPWRSYLKDAVDGLNPFAYIDGTTTNPKLVDAARNDLADLKMGMVVPGDYPHGTYIVQGNIESGDDPTEITLKLIIADSDSEQQASVEIGVDVVVEIGPTSLNFGIVVPSEGAKEGPQITLDASQSNVATQVEAQVTENALFEGIELDNGGWTAIDGAVIGLAVGETKNIDTRITIPIGTAPGIETGTIVYTVTGAP